MTAGVTGVTGPASGIFVLPAVLSEADSLVETESLEEADMLAEILSDLISLSEAESLVDVVLLAEIDSLSGKEVDPLS